MERSRHAAPPRLPRRRWDHADVAILMSGILAFLALTFGGPLVQNGSSLALDGTGPAAAANPSSTAPSTTPAPAPASTPPPGPVLPASAAPLRVRYPAADFNVPVHPLKLDSRAKTIEPPPTKDGYWLSPYGSPGKGSSNTTYVIGHSWDGADAPFNHLSSQAAKGDRFAVDTASGTITYRVDSITTYVKEGLKDSPIWDVVPNRLVLISCYTQDLWGENVVVIASPAPA